jgi:hypothetical protein
VVSLCTVVPTEGRVNDQLPVFSERRCCGPHLCIAGHRVRPTLGGASPRPCIGDASCWYRFPLDTPHHSISSAIGRPIFISRDFKGVQLGWNPAFVDRRGCGMVRLVMRHVAFTSHQPSSSVVPSGNLVWSRAPSTTPFINAEQMWRSS